MTTHFPEGFWYDFATGHAVINEKQITQALGTFEIALWVRGGTILPVLDHNKELSLLEAYKNPVALKVYPDAENKAFGKLLLDDTWSQSLDQCVVEFKFGSGKLWLEVDRCSYPTTLKISEITVYSVSSKTEQFGPTSIYLTQGAFHTLITL